MKLRLASYFSILLSLLTLVDIKAHGAACCGGGFAAPSIIAGDDKAQLTSSFSSFTVVIDNVSPQGIWRKWDVHQQVQTFKIEGAHIFWDRYQAGFSLPVIQRSRGSLIYSGLGDVSTSIGYEYLPDWDYNPYRPKGIGFLQVIFPTGKSRADSEIGGLDSRGNGFWALGLGTLLTKTWSRVDAFTSLEVHRSFGKDVSNSQFSGRLEPGLGGTFGLGLGYNTKDYRLGSSITWTYEDAIKTQSSSEVTNNGSIERFATGVLSLSYMLDDEWAGTLSYSDQTLFGSPVNTSLGRGIALQLQKRWGR
jgi:hypothetical protein